MVAINPPKADEDAKDEQEDVDMKRGKYFSAENAAMSFLRRVPLINTELVSYIESYREKSRAEALT